MVKLVFLPHCLRSTECKAALKEEGYECLSCGKCRIWEFQKKAKEKEYKVYIVPGASMIKKILKNYDSPEVVIGVACDTEIREGAKLMKKMKINAKSLKLTKDGCVNTEVDFDKLIKML